MARIFTCGFELNSLTQGMERYGSTSQGSIVTSPVKNSTYALRINPSAAAQTENYAFNAGSGIKTIYERFHFYATTMPPADALVHTITQSDLTTIMMRLRGTGSGLKVMNSANTQVGSNIALSTGQWYCIEIKCFSSAASGTIDVLVDQVSVVSNTGLNTQGGDIAGGQFGSGVATTSDYYIDNFAVNDTSGSFQNSWIGDGYIIALRPDSAGDAADFTRGGSDSGANWSQCDEVTPNDATDYNVSTTSGHIDMFNCGASGINSYDVVNLVHVGYRLSNPGDPGSTSNVRCIKTSGGTVASGSSVVAIAPATWRSNGTATTAYNPYTLTLYQDPDSADWTQSTLDTMQIGYTATSSTANGVAVSAVWAMVDYSTGTPPAGGVPGTNRFMMGVG